MEGWGESRGMGTMEDGGAGGVTGDAGMEETERQG